MLKGRIVSQRLNLYFSFGGKFSDTASGRSIVIGYDNIIPNLCRKTCQLASQSFFPGRRLTFFPLVITFLPDFSRFVTNLHSANLIFMPLYLYKLLFPPSLVSCCTRYCLFPCTRCTTRITFLIILCCIHMESVNWMPFLANLGKNGKVGRGDGPCVPGSCSRVCTNMHFYFLLLVSPCEDKQEEQTHKPFSSDFVLKQSKNISAIVH